ncbi:MAG: monovalent cation/H+ antiporter subunit D family protein, partial [Desulfurivibrionaceae bacterium]
KWYLVLGTLEADQIAMLVVLLVSSLLNTAYFIPVFYRAFFCNPEESQFEAKVKEAPLWCLVPLIFSSVVSLALFFYPQPFFQLAEQAVASFSGG